MVSEGDSLLGEGLCRRRKGSESQDHGSHGAKGLKREREKQQSQLERVKPQHRWRQECERK